MEPKKLISHCWRKDKNHQKTDQWMIQPINNLMARRKFKRFRRTVVNSSQKRPIDKAIVGGALNLSGLSQLACQIYPISTSIPPVGASFPGTITGLRWAVDALPAGAITGINVTKWIIVKCREGQQPSAMTVGVGPSPLYTPEQMSWLGVK